MNFVRDEWFCNGNLNVRRNMVSLLPIEMLNLCECAAMCNPLLILSDVAWNWHTLSQNKNITFDFILSQPNGNWNWYML